MAHSAQAKKRIRQSEKARQHNRIIRSTLRTHLKNTLHAIEKKDVEAAKKAYDIVVPLLDRNARKNIIHKNKAARHKERLLKQIRSLSS